ncbi:SDR family oxidoreductase [Gordonia hydrophobica]|uniref:SDR family oxidoreductase n=1 Tax=Gordonia hydrophobica TaxID=40516 RepID=A0ABZ2TZU2_9ACTN|nr:SDR family oxidoreductase [Gordonia hydrophobica]MBM7369223.1 NAD(P)-dependent dehydrogenase (short-subunit alcohol dehydrogenase family) [Gordonia hydrophobica]
MPTVLLVGATGTVGRAAAEVFAGHGWRVIGVARSAERLADLRNRFPEHVEVVEGSLATPETTEALAATLDVSAVDAVVLTTSMRWEPRPIAALDDESLREVLAGDLFLHVNAARAFIPRMRREAVYLATGGGMADHTFPGMGPVSMTQAAQRALLRSWHKETTSGVEIRELMISSMVRGHSLDDARPASLTAVEVAERLVDVVERPEHYPGPVISIDPSIRDATAEESAAESP